MRRTAVFVAACALGCSTGERGATPVVAPVADAAPPAVESETQAPPAPPPPVWTLEPRGDADRALLQRLVDPDDRVRGAAAEEWETARVASWEVVMKEPGFAPPWPSENPVPVDWEREDDETPPRSEGDAIRRAFDNRTRALARGLVVALREGDVPTRVAAASSIGDLRLPVGRHPTQALADADSGVRVAAARALTAQTPFESKYEACLPAMRKLLDDPDWRVRVEGCRGVSAYDDASSMLHEEAKAAVPRLIQLAADEHAEVRERALSTLGEIEPWGRDAELRVLFLRALRDPEIEVRREALRWFRERMDRTDARTAEPELIEALRPFMSSPDRSERFIAAAAIWKATRETASTVPIFTDVVVHAEGRAPLGALELLTEIGPAAESATEAVLSVLTLDEEIRHFATGTEAMDALHSIGPRAAFALPLLRPMLADGDPKVRAAAARAVETLDGDDDGRERLLARMLTTEQEDEVRAAIHEARAAIGAGGDAVVADLVRGLHADEYERWSAIAGLRAMGPRAAVAAPHLLAIVEAKPPDGTGRMAAGALVAVSSTARVVDLLPRIRAFEGAADLAAARLRALGPADAGLVLALRTQLDDSPAAIARALAELGPAARDALPSLERLLRTRERMDRIALAEAVLRIGGDRDAALKILVDAIDRAAAQDAEQDVRELGTQSAYALGRSGDAGRPAVPALRRLATSGGFEENHAAAFAIWRITGEIEPCVEAAIVAVRDNYTPTPPTDLVESIGAMGPAAARATPTLVHVALAWRTKFWRNSDLSVHAAAIRALGLIGPGAAAALPTLREIRRNSIFRAVAEDAIRRIEAR